MFPNIHVELEKPTMIIVQFVRFKENLAFLFEKKGCQDPTIKINRGISRFSN